jgi:hypothetical protein
MLKPPILLTSQFRVKPAKAKEEEGKRLIIPGFE